MGTALLCPTCGADHVDARLAYRAALRVTLQGWREAGLVSAPAHDTLGVRLAAEDKALRRLGAAPVPLPAGHPTPRPTLPAVAPAGSPRPGPGAGVAPTPPADPAPAVAPLPLPGLPPSPEDPAQANGLGAWLRERVGWVTGVLLTVVGSIYLAGTIWSDLPPLWRQALVWSYLALSAVGFARVGRRLQAHPGAGTAARWLTGVSVALVPVHALAAGGLFRLDGPIGAIGASVALAACGLLHARVLRDSLPRLCPGVSTAFSRTWLVLALSVGLLPLATGPGWLILPAVGALGVLWLGVTQGRRVGWLPALLVAECLAFHVAFTPLGPPSAYGPVLALAALGCLYLDAARARWRGLHRTRPSAPLGLAAAALALAALGALGTTLSPLPTTAASLLTAVLLTAFFAAASASWRRPGVWVGALAAALLAFLALPAQFALAVQWLAGQAGAALGYTDEPLPLAWYSLTLLPYLALVRWASDRLSASGWRQAAALGRNTLAWGAGLSLALMLAAHGRPDDLRPALLALPLHTALWAWGRPLRHRGWGAAAAVIAGVWLAGALHQVGCPDPVVLTVIGAGVVAAGWSARAWLPRAVEVEAPLALIGLVLGLVGLAGCADLVGLSTAGWAVGAGVMALSGAAGVAATERWLPDRTGPAAVLAIAAHLLAATAVAVATSLDGLPRTLARLPVALALVHWLYRYRHPAHGVVLCLGLAELVVRQAHGLGLIDPGLLAALAAGIAWLPLAARGFSWGERPWLDRALARPSAAVAGTLGGVALVLLTIQGFTTGAQVLAVAGLTAAVAATGWRAPGHGLALGARVLATWTAVAALQWLGVPPEAQGWLLAAAATVMVLVSGERDWARLQLSVALGAAAIAGVTGGLESPSLPLLILALGWLGTLAWRRPALAWVGAAAAGLLAANAAAIAPWVQLSALTTAGVLIAMLTGARRDAAALPLLGLVGLLGLGGERALAGDTVLVAVIGLHAVGVALARARRQHPVFAPDDGWLAAPLWVAAALALPGLDTHAPHQALVVAIGAAAALGGRRGLLTLWVPLGAAALVASSALELAVLGPLWAALGLVLRPWLPWTTVLCLVLAVPAEVFLAPAAQVSAVVLLAPALALAWELRRGWSRDQGWRWWTALGWLGWGLVVARAVGPLQGVPESWLLPIGVGLAVVMEGLRGGVEPHKGAAFVRPLARTARTLPLAMLVLSAALGALTTWGLALVGCLSLLRYVFRPRTSDLLLGAALVDAAALWWMADASVVDPILWVAPISLSLLVLARLLRDSLGTQTVALLRYVAAGALYLAAFTDLALSPGGSLVMVLLGLLGVALGTGFRVRAYLHLGAGVAVAAVLADALRFGLAHSQFWALYLTTLGLLILAGMVAGTLHRERLRTATVRLRTAMAGWD